MSHDLTTVVFDKNDTQYFNVPSPTSYSYVSFGPKNLDPILEAPNKLEAKMNLIGQSINTSGETTAFQTARQAIAFGTMASTFMTIASWSLAASTNIIGLGVLATVTGLGLTAHLYSQEDLNSPAELSAATAKIATKQFSTIVQDNTVEDILGFALLDGIIEKNDTARTPLYAKLIQLNGELDKITQQKNALISDVLKTYAANGGVLEKKWVITKPEIDKTTGKATVVTVKPNIKPSQEQTKADRLLPSYCPRLTEWVDWKVRTIAAINNDYSKQVQKINQAFEAQIKTPVPITVN